VVDTVPLPIRIATVLGIEGGGYGARDFGGAGNARRQADGESQSQQRALEQFHCDPPCLCPNLLGMACRLLGGAWASERSSSLALSPIWPARMLTFGAPLSVSSGVTGNPAAPLLSVWAVDLVDVDLFLDRRPQSLFEAGQELMQRFVPIAH